jgi:hypothetical protein
MDDGSSFRYNRIAELEKEIDELRNLFYEFTGVKKDGL